MAEQKSHTARVHAWFKDEEGREVHVTRRDDGKFYLNTNGAPDPIAYMSMADAVAALEKAHDEGREIGWMSGLPEGQAFDAEVGAILTSEKAPVDVGDAGTEDPQA